MKALAYTHTRTLTQIKNTQINKNSVPYLPVGRREHEEGAGGWNGFHLGGDVQFRHPARPRYRMIFIFIL